MKSQLASPTFTPTYAALIAIINTKFPEIGELLLKRVISQVGMHGSLHLSPFAYLPARSLSAMHPKGQSHATQKHGSLVAVSINRDRYLCAWRDCVTVHDCAFLTVLLQQW